MPASDEWYTRPKAASWKGELGYERGLARLSLKGGQAGQTEIRAKGIGVNWPMGTFLIDTPLVVQLANLETGRCWPSRFETADVKTDNATVFKAKDAP